MGAHFPTPVARPRPGRRRQVGILSIALGVGLLAFAFVDEDGTPVRNTSPTVPPSSEPTVLGVTVEPEPTAPGAEPATAVSLSSPDDDDGEGTPTTAAPGPTTTRPPSTTTTEGAVLIPPTVVTNTVPPRPPTTTSTTTTTQSTTTTESTTSTSDTTTPTADGSAAG